VAGHDFVLAIVHLLVVVFAVGLVAHVVFCQGYLVVPLCQLNFTLPLLVFGYSGGNLRLFVGKCHFLLVSHDLFVFDTLNGD
jgi:hypothetical protein